MTRREFLAVMAAAVASAASIGAISNTPSARQAPRRPTPSRPGAFKVAVVLPSHCALPLVLARAAGIYERQGIDVELVPMASHTDAADSLQQGDVHAAQLAGPLFFALHQGTGPYKDNRTPLVSMQVAGIEGGALLASARTEIQSAGRLKGRKVATGGTHLVQTLLLREALMRAGLDPEKDLELAEMDMADLPAALMRGEADACMALEPYATSAIDSGAGRVISASAQLWHGHPCCYIAVRRETMLVNASKAEAFYSATLQAGARLREAGAQRDDAFAALLNDPAKLPVDQVREALEAGRAGFDPYPYKSSGEALIRLMKSGGIMDGPVNPARIVSDALLGDRTRMMMGSLGIAPPASDRRRETVAGIIFQ